MARLAWLLLLASSARADEWDDVTAFLDGFTNLTDCDGCNCVGCHGFAFTAGNASGRQYSYEKETTLSEHLVMASASKFPAAIAVAGAVADEYLSFDTFAHDVFPWWAANASDPRSGVTLRQLLSFTSGFYWYDASSGNVSCMDGISGSLRYTPEECAEQIYHNAPFPWSPGETFAYNSFHLQIAGAMAAKAAGLTVQQLLDKYLIGKLGLTSTGWLLGQNPVLAAGMYTTANEYDRILASYLSYELLPEEVASQMEVDYLAPPYAGEICDWCVDLAPYFGHYSMCNWYECLHDNATDGRFTPACTAQRIHMDLGLFGYYPLIDRAKGLYLQAAMRGSRLGQPPYEAAPVRGGPLWRPF